MLLETAEADLFNFNIPINNVELSGWLIVFYGLSTRVGYLMLNLVYIYILDVYNLLTNSFLNNF